MIHAKILPHSLYIHKWCALPEQEGHYSRYTHPNHYLFIWPAQFISPNYCGIEICWYYISSLPAVTSCKNLKKFSFFFSRTEPRRLTSSLRFFLYYNQILLSSSLFLAGRFQMNSTSVSFFPIFPQKRELFFLEAQIAALATLFITSHMLVRSPIELMLPRFPVSFSINL